MSELRKRKAAPTKDKTKQFQANGSSKINSSRITPSPKETVCWYNVANIFLGTIIAVIVGVKYALYVRELHENNLWFSNIRVRVKLDDTCFFFLFFFCKCLMVDMLKILHHPVLWRGCMIIISLLNF